MRMQASRLVFKVHYSDTEEVEDNNLAEAVQYEPRGHLKKKVKFFDARGQQSPPVVAEGCWNCKQKEHFYHQCPSMQREVFCFKCEYPKVVTPTCPTCSSKNEQRVAPKTL